MTTETMTTSASTQTGLSFTMPAPALREMLASATVATAGPKDAVPVLCAVRVEWAQWGVTVVATDRYRLAELTFQGPASEDAVSDTDGAVQIHVSDVKRILALLPKATARQRKADWPTVTVHVPSGQRETDTHVTVTVHQYGNVLGSLTFVNVLGDFPKWRSLMPTDEQLSASDGVAACQWNPAYMADVARMPIDKGEHVRCRFVGANRPMLLTPGYERKPGDVDWRYLLMPVRTVS